MPRDGGGVFLEGFPQIDKYFYTGQASYGSSTYGDRVSGWD